MKTTTLLTILALSALPVYSTLAGADSPKEKLKTETPVKAAKKDAKPLKKEAKVNAKVARDIEQQQKEIETARQNAADRVLKVQADSKKSKLKQDAEIAKINQERDKKIALKTKRIAKLKQKAAEKTGGKAAK